MNTAIADRPVLCAGCGSVMDAQQFDAVRFVDKPEAGAAVIVVRAELPRQFCGLLEGFQQYDERQLEQPGLVETPWIEWGIRINGRPLDPYLSFTALLNRWGERVNPVALRLDEGAAVEIVARGVAGAFDASLREGRIGGRLMGRYWFNDAYGRPMSR